MSKGPAFVHVETTFPAGESAQRKFVGVILERRLAACANRFGPVASTYWWKGALEEAQESLIVFKTTAERADGLIEAIRAAHPYETPYVAILDLEVRASAYAHWLIAETQADARSAPAPRPRSRTR